MIGATNRPDAIDPALRRPGRFDREFYFPLPNLEGRRKILDIHTNGWNPPIEESFKDELANLTKGYGGADLRVGLSGLYFLLARLSNLEFLTGPLHGSCAERGPTHVPSNLQDERAPRDPA